MRDFTAVGLALLLLLFTWSVPAARADITPTGDVAPDPSTWTTSTGAYVGNTAAGTLTVNGDSTLTCSSCTLGRNSGSTGTVTISGSGAALNCTYGITVGAQGTGTLSILDGGTVSSDRSWVGDQGSATIEVSGNGSKWTTAGDLYAGNGMFLPTTTSMSISDGGSVQDGAVWLAMRPTSTVTITVDGANSTWQTSGDFHLTNGGTSTVTQNDGLVTVGGTLTMANGGTGTYNLNGGTLAVHNIQPLAGTSVFNFNGGTLRADADFTTDLNATLTGTDTIDTNAHDVIWNGALTGTGTLVKTGDDSLTLNNYSYTGGTNVQGGTLYATKGFSCSSSSPLTIGLTPTLCGTLRVTGTADVGGTLHVTSASGTYSPGATYTFLMADAISGTFAGVVDDLAFFDLLLAYNSDNINFTLIPTGSYVDEARTGNQYAVANYLNAHKSGATGDFSTVLDALNTLDGDGARSAFNAMSGEIYGSLATVSIENNERFLRTIANRMRMESMFRDGDFTTAGTCRDNSLVYVSRRSTSLDDLKNRLSGWTTWFDSYGIGASVAGNGNASGLGYSTGGMAVGMERYLDDYTLFGFGGGYASSRTNLNDRSDWGSIDGGQFTAYMRRDINDNYLTGIFAYGYNSYGVNRSIDFATIDRAANSNYNGNNYSTYFEAGRNIYGRYVNWQPFAGLEYIGVQQNSFAEQNANSIDLNVNSSNANAFRGLLGTRVLNYYRTSTGRLLTLDASVAWRHEFLNDNRIFDASFAGQTGGGFTVSGVNVDRDAAIIGTGVNYALFRNCSVYANYDLLFGNGYTAHAGLGGLQYAW